MNIFIRQNVEFHLYPSLQELHDVLQPRNHKQSVQRPFHSQGVLFLGNSIVVDYS